MAREATRSRTPNRSERLVSHECCGAALNSSCTCAAPTSLAFATPSSDASNVHPSSDFMSVGDPQTLDFCSKVDSTAAVDCPSLHLSDLNASVDKRRVSRHSDLFFSAVESASHSPRVAGLIPTCSPSTDDRKGVLRCSDEVTRSPIPDNVGVLSSPKAKSEARADDVKPTLAERLQGARDPRAASVWRIEWKCDAELLPELKIKRQLGEGTFSHVFLAQTPNYKEYAVKMIKNEANYAEDARCEAAILRRLQSYIHEKAAQHVTNGGLLRFYGSFDSTTKPAHYCLLFELLGPSLRSVLSCNGCRGFYMEDIQAMARQLLKMLCFLSFHGLAHTDLKPENILLQYDGFHHVQFSRDHSNTDNRRYYRPADNFVKIADYGAAVFSNEKHGFKVGTRTYRAPEVILEAGWSFPVDVFSLGCILMELYTGHALFRPAETCKSFNHLRAMELVVGPMSSNILERASSRVKALGLRGIPHSRPLWELSVDPVLDVQMRQLYATPQRIVSREHEMLTYLVYGALTLDDRKRPKPIDLLNYGFFLTSYAE
eukprot:GEMP01005627.1.p1 GENE.GEMP01005627.1~~GEMP01005627.1.p1  ORF type:complete len:544 (+),score=80.05 GEMP01005627.1:73-1704(+)